LKTLFDTNVLSEIRRPKGSERVKRFARSLDEFETFISVVSLGEIPKGIALLIEGKQRQSLHRWLQEIKTEYQDQILICDIETAEIWGELTASAQRAGRVLAAADGLIAATALRHGLQLATRNIRHFADTEVPLINPWEA
jgi:predicted nucleic acid-binding protein